MPSSLTAFLPQLVIHLGMTQSAIYERQRALVRLGLLAKPTGRGRGSGAEATPANVSLILLSVLATDNLSDMDGRIAALAQSKIDEWRKRKQCGLTKQTILIHALTDALADPSLARRLNGLYVNRTELTSKLTWNHKISGNFGMSTFVEHRKLVRSSLQVEARIDSDALRQISAMLQAESTV